MKHKFDIGKMLADIAGDNLAALRAAKKNPERFAMLAMAPDFNTLTSTYRQLYDFNPVTRNGVAFMPIKIGGILLPLAVMTISGKKTIVETALTGAKGTVKELISVDDYDISITGMLYNAEGVYPEAEIRSFMELYNRSESVSLVSALSDMVFEQGNDKVVLKSINFHDMKGCENMQGVTISCVSDAPFELIIN